MTVYTVDILAPLLYIALQAGVLLPIVLGHYTASSRDRTGEIIFLFIWTLVTLFWYLKTAWTNPGFLQGSSQDEAKKAGAYDPAMYAINTGSA